MEHGRLGASVRWLFTDRNGGVSPEPYASANLGGHVGDDPGAVEANRDALARQLGLSRTHLLFMNQVHGNDVRVVDDSTAVGKAAVDTAPYDAQVTTATGLALAVLVADCVPVLMADPDAGVIAAVHAGRPGVHNGVVDRALDRMIELGAVSTNVTAWLGPAVCGACYEVPEAMRAEVAAVAPGAWATSRTGTPALDLRAGLTRELEGRGVMAHSIGPCTRETPELYSYRRESRTGRFAGVIWREP